MLTGSVRREACKTALPPVKWCDAPDDNESENEGNSLEDVVRDEEELPRERLREQLGREPTEDEVNDWLNQHTEGY